MSKARSGHLNKSEWLKQKENAEQDTGKEKGSQIMQDAVDYSKNLIFIRSTVGGQ